MDKDLQNIWHNINKNLFDGGLRPLSAIDWATLSGADGIGAHGRFFPKSHCIVIDEKFKFDADAIRAGNKAEQIKAEFAFHLMIHEMVHQALHQKHAANPGGHGASFLSEAQRISEKLGVKTPTAENVHLWPVIPSIDPAI